MLVRHQIAAQVLTAINAALAQQGLLLKMGTVVDASINTAPGSTKNKTGQSDSEIHHF